MFDYLESCGNLTLNGVDPRTIAENLYQAATFDLKDFPSLQDITSCDPNRLGKWRSTGRIWYSAASNERAGSATLDLSGIGLDITAGYVIGRGGKIDIYWRSDYLTVEVKNPRLVTLQRLGIEDLRRCSYSFEGNHYAPSCEPNISPERLFKLFPILSQIMKG